MLDAPSTLSLRALTEAYRRQRFVNVLAESFENPTYEEIKDAYRPAPGSEAATKKINPTVDFMKKAYSIFNKELFGGKLPPNLELDVDVNTSDTAFGRAGYKCDSLNEEIIPRHITLNNRYQMTFHDWLDVLLHECIHIFEYVTNPEPFLRRHSGGRYDAHGPWFLNVASRFDDLGFNVRKYCTATPGSFGINMDDRRIARAVSRQLGQYVAARLVGVQEERGGGVVKISRKMLPRLEEILRQTRNVNGLWWSKVRKLEYYVTENPLFANLKKAIPKDEFSGFRYYYWDSIEAKYGPFALVGEFDPSQPTGDVKPLKVKFLEGVDRTTLAMKIFNSIVGRKFRFWDYETEKSLKYIKPVIKNPLGVAVECIVSDYNDAHDLGKLFIDDKCHTIYMSKRWVEDMASKFGDDTTNVFDDYYLTTDYQQFRSDDEFFGDGDDYKGMSVAASMNAAIGNVVSNVEEKSNGSIAYLKGQCLDAVDELVGKVVSDNASGYTQTESATCGTVEEDIDEMPAEERHLLNDEYARRAWDINGVVDVKVEDDGVLVAIA